MIKYKKQQYYDIRTPISDEVLMQLFSETCKVNKVDIDDDTARKIVTSYITGILYYLYKNPEYYIDMKKFVLYRDTNLNNLVTIEAKGDNNAQTILDYYSKGGVMLEELEKLIMGFVNGLLTHSIAKQAELTEKISNIENLTNKCSE